MKNINCSASKLFVNGVSGKGREGKGRKKEGMEGRGFVVKLLFHFSKNLGGAG